MDHASNPAAEKKQICLGVPGHAAHVKRWRLPALSALLQQRHDLDYTQIALPDDGRYETVAWMARQAAAVGYDVDG